MLFGMMERCVKVRLAPGTLAGVLYLRFTRTGVAVLQCKNSEAAVHSQSDGCG